MAAVAGADADVDEVAVRRVDERDVRGVVEPPNVFGGRSRGGRPAELRDDAARDETRRRLRRS